MTDSKYIDVVYSAEKKPFSDYPSKLIKELVENLEEFKLTEDIEQFASNLKAANTALVPILLTLFFLGRFYFRTRRSRELNQ